MKTKVAVVGMRSRDGEVRAKSVESVNTQVLQDFLDKNVLQASVIPTDKARFYRDVRGYHKLLVNHSVGEFVNGMAFTNGIESVWSVLKRGFMDTCHHFSKKHIDKYVDEFVFRFNEGNVKHHTLERINSLIEGCLGKRLTYSELIW